MKSMKPMKHVSKKNDAVSPVVGVMLMLVVTIIIAAVVAVFASGLVTSQEPAKNTVITLDDYTMGTILYTGYNPYGYVNNSFEEGFNKTKLATAVSPNYGAFGIYGMVFNHKGGETLRIDDLTLSITNSGATFETPLTAAHLSISKNGTFSAGDKLKISIPESKLASLTDGNLFGLGQQDMYMGGYGKYDEFSWALKDKNNNVIAKGTQYLNIYDGNEVPVASITVTGNGGATSVTVGGTLQLTATVSPVNATVKTITWSSNNESTATVDSSGLVTGVASGNVTITATAMDGSGVTGTVEITVT